MHLNMTSAKATRLQPAITLTFLMLPLSVGPFCGPLTVSEELTFGNSSPLGSRVGSFQHSNTSDGEEHEYFAREQKTMIARDVTGFYLCIFPRPEIGKFLDILGRFPPKELPQPET